MLFEELGNGGVAGDTVGVLQHIMALILKNQIVGLLSGCLKLLNHIPRLALNDAGIVLALNHEQRASDLLHVGARRAFQFSPLFVLSCEKGRKLARGCAYQDFTTTLL